jgi:hypothetical protein
MTDVGLGDWGGRLEVLYIFDFLFLIFYSIMMRNIYINIIKASGMVRETAGGAMWG